MRKFFKSKWFRWSVAIGIIVGLLRVIGKSDDGSLRTTER